MKQANFPQRVNARRQKALQMDRMDDPKNKIECDSLMLSVRPDRRDERSKKDRRNNATIRRS